MKALLQTASRLSACGHEQTGGWVPVPPEKRFLINWTKKAVFVMVALTVLFAWSALADDMVLSWNGAEKDPHPCLYVTAKDVAAVKATRKDLAALAAKTQFAPVGDEAIAAVLLVQNPAAEKAVITAAGGALTGLINAIGGYPHGHSQISGMAVGLADAALAAKTITPEERASLLSKIARASYLVNDPGYFNPETSHGSLCPNMFTSAAGYRLTLAALIPSHPKAKAWFDGALAELKQQLDDWVDPQGGMVETPHYSMVIYDQWVAAFLIARNAGAPEDGQLFHPKLRKAIEWFGNISTPRDPRNNGFRRLPSIGHTYYNERTGMFGVMACLWKDRDPAFAAEMEWMHREQGSFGEPGILSYYPGFMGYRSFFKESGVTPDVPSWGSQFYQETGVQLRNTIGSDRETTLYMIAGRNHSHYYNDSGSITIWGKGSELCDEDNYQFKRAKESRESHSMIDKPATYNEERVMELKEFSRAQELDYVSGVRSGWTRQIAFVKDADPLAPNYFVLADTVDTKSVPTIWRLFLSAREVKPIPNGVTVIGKDDVDMDIIFVRPARVNVQVHAETLPPTPYSKDQILVHHIAVVVEQAGTLTAVLYPRLKTEKSPVVRPLANGRGARMVTPVGTDIVYLNPEPIKARVGGKTFEGKVCLLKKRGGKSVRVLPGTCDIPRDYWTDGDPQLRQIHWPKGPQYPPFPDYEEAITPNADNILVLDQQHPATISGFLVTQTRDQASREKTDVAVKWDNDALDVTFTCTDNGIVAAITDNDNIKLWRDDSVYVWLDPGHTHNEKAFMMIQLSASGARYDLKNGDATFNVEDMTTSVSRTETGWTAHLRIPWKGLGVAAPKAGDVWGVNFTRMDHPGKYDFKTMEISSWAAIPFHPGDPSDLIRWGHLVFALNGDETGVTTGRNAIAKKHQAMVERAYSREALVK